jgi:hypothetical protein
MMKALVEHSLILLEKGNHTWTDIMVIRLATHCLNLHTMGFRLIALLCRGCTNLLLRLASLRGY